MTTPTGSGQPSPLQNSIAGISREMDNITSFMGRTFESRDKTNEKLDGIIKRVNELETNNRGFTSTTQVKNFIDTVRAFQQTSGNRTTAETTFERTIEQPTGTLPRTTNYEELDKKWEAVKELAGTFTPKPVEKAKVEFSKEQRGAAINVVLNNLQVLKDKIQNRNLTPEQESEMNLSTLRTQLLVKDQETNNLGRNVNYLKQMFPEDASKLEKLYSNIDSPRPIGDIEGEFSSEGGVIGDQSRDVYQVYINETIVPLEKYLNELKNKQ